MALVSSLRSLFLVTKPRAPAEMQRLQKCCASWEVNTSTLHSGNWAMIQTSRSRPSKPFITRSRITRSGAHSLMRALASAVPPASRMWVNASFWQISRSAPRMTGWSSTINTSFKAIPQVITNGTGAMTAPDSCTSARSCHLSDPTVQTSGLSQRPRPCLRARVHGCNDSLA